MTEITQAMMLENGNMRALLGSGEPGLNAVLGGTVKEEGADSLRMTGGAGQVSATSRIARSYNDVRLAAVAAGNPVPPAGGGGGGVPGRPGQGGNPGPGRLP